MSYKDNLEQLKMGFFNDYSPGQINWLPLGLNAMNGLKQVVSRKLIKSGYRFVETPTLGSNELWSQTGHLQKFSENMFHVKDELKCLKPMNCPMHAQIFKKMFRMEGKLPFKVSEFASLYRNEESGALNGLLRLYKFTQDDSHVFCNISHLEEVIGDFINNLYAILKIVGLSIFKIELSGINESFIGSKEDGIRSEKLMAEIVEKHDLQIKDTTKEGAFYGPKIDFHLMDSHAKMWQCSTVQIDLCMPKTMGLDCECVVHHAHLGTFERTMAIILDNIGSQPLPFPINPIRCYLLTTKDISEDSLSWANSVLKIIQEKVGIEYVQYNFKPNDLSDKLRKSLILRPNYILIIGNQEAAHKMLSVRQNNKTTKQNFKRFMSALDLQLKF